MVEFTWISLDFLQESAISEMCPKMSFTSEVIHMNVQVFSYISLQFELPNSFSSLISSISIDEKLEFYRLWIFQKFCITRTCRGLKQGKTFPSLYPRFWNRPHSDFSFFFGPPTFARPFEDIFAHCFRSLRMIPPQNL